MSTGAHLWNDISQTKLCNRLNRIKAIYWITWWITSWITSWISSQVMRVTDRDSVESVFKSDAQVWHLPPNPWCEPMASVERRPCDCVPVVWLAAVPDWETWLVSRRTAVKELTTNHMIVGQLRPILRLSVDWAPVRVVASECSDQWPVGDQPLTQRLDSSESDRRKWSDCWQIDNW